MKPRLPTVADYMTREVLTVRENTPVLDAVDLLVSHGVSGVPVLDGRGRLVGLLSEKDCLRLTAKGAAADVPRGTVADYMSRKVATIPPDMDVYYAAGLFLKNVYRRFPVMAHDQLVGVVSRGDILKAVRELLQGAT